MKKNKKEIIMISIMVLVLIIGITYAYFILRKNLEISNMISGYLDMTFTDNDDELILGSTTPIYEEDIDDKSSYTTFDIKNTGNIDMYTEIYFKDIVMNNELKSYDFKWRIEDITENEVKIINEGTFISVKDNKRYLASNQKIEPTKTRKYRVRIWVEETEKDQSKLDSTSFKGTIAATAYSREIGGVPNEPKLTDGLIPVVYDWDNDVWLKAGGENYWYDYDNQMWANAVTVNSSASTCNDKNNCVDSAEKHDRTFYMEADAGTPISMDDINTMWVWIPRYKYRIPANMGSTVGIPAPPMIDVIFENGIANTGVSEEKYRNSLGESNTYSKYYYTHPAFINGEEVNNGTPYDIGGWDEELTGIWYSKFDTSKLVSTFYIKPNISHDAQFQMLKKFKNSFIFSGGEINEKTGKVTFNGNEIYGLESDVDTHLSKGTEWAVVAYLYASRYGKLGNENYVGINKRIYQNDTYYNGFCTGCSSGIIDGYEVCGRGYYYKYNDIKCNVQCHVKTECTNEKEQYKGTGASTTGTIYGIYDMVGDSGKILMSNYNHYVGNRVIESNGSERLDLSGFNGKLDDDTEYTDGIPFPERKYYDLYIYEYAPNSKKTVIMGDSTWEVNSWNDSNNPFKMNKKSPWLCRSSWQDGDIFVFNSSTSRDIIGEDFVYSSAYRSVLIIN